MHRRTQNLGKNLEREHLSQLPLKDSLFVAPDTALFAVFEMMRAAKSGCALVREGDKLLGIFTERDILTRVIEADLPLETVISEVMTPDPQTLPGDSTIAQAVHVMDEGGYRNIPITDPKTGNVIKTLSARDLVTYFGSNFPEEVYNLPPEPNQVQTDREGA